MNSTGRLPETLVGLVEHYSPSGQECRATTYLVNRMKALGFQAASDAAGNAIGTRGAGCRQVVLMGHIDTVPGEIPIRLEEDYFFGRGSVDAKGSLAAFVDAAASIDISQDWQVVVIGAVDEERNSIGATYAIPNFHPEAAIVGEPSHWDRITLGYKGSANAEVSVVSSKGHTARKDLSACEAAVEIWKALQAWAASFNTNRSAVFDQLLLTLRKFDTLAGDFEDRARMQIGARLPLDLPPEAYYQQLRQIAIAAEVCEVGFPIPAYRAEKQNGLVRAFSGGIRAIGGEPGFLLKSGTADMNLAGPVWNCPIVAYGPGDASLDHTPDEHLSVSEYYQAVAVLQIVLKRLMK